MGRIYQQTFIDNYSRIAFTRLYDSKHAITSANIHNDRVLPFVEEQEMPLFKILADHGEHPASRLKGMNRQMKKEKQEAKNKFVQLIGCEYICHRSVA